MKVVIIGQGRMGSLLKETFEKEHEVLALTDKLNPEGLINNLDQTDLIVDFSHPDNCSWVLENIRDKQIPYLVGTTALSEKDLEALHDYAKTAPVFFDSNYSLGIAVLKDLAAKAAEVLKEDFDIEVLEKHHNQKQDAPSGTAISIVEAIDPEGEFERVYGRSGWTGARKKEIGVQAIRGGTLPGYHEVEFLGPDESISIAHNAQNRQIFVNGAYKAGKFLVDQPAGFYSMKEYIANHG